MLSSRNRVAQKDASLPDFSISFPLHCSEYNQGSAELRPTEQLFGIISGTALICIAVAYYPEIRPWHEEVFQLFESETRQKNPVTSICDIGSKHCVTTTIPREYVLGRREDPPLMRCKGGYAFLGSKWASDVGLVPDTCFPYGWQSYAVG